MPELPEVNTFKKYFDQTALGQRIEEVRVYDDRIIRDRSGEDFAARLAGRCFTGSYRRGKYLFATLDNGHHVQLHFGMTGDLNYYQEEADRTRFERFAFRFANGYQLGFDDPRKFARVAYVEDLPQHLRSINLGQDALEISEEAFLQLMKSKAGALKGFLLNQQYIAGVGNLYADEICYQARIHPASRIDRLPNADRKCIYRLMRDILSYAIDRDAYYKDYPDDWLWQWRKEGRPGPEGQGIVKKMKVAGRTTYFCEGWQKRY